MLHKDSFFLRPKIYLFWKAERVIPYYSKEKLINLPEKWKLSFQKMSKITNQGFFLSPSCLPLCPSAGKTQII